MRNRFEEEFGVLDAQGARRMFRDFERLGAAMPMRAIGSFELLRRPEFADRFEETNLPIDLLIVDEAHHLRNAGTRTYELAEALVNTSEAVLFLTATPLNLRNLDLFNLLSLIAPEDFDNSYLFEQQIEPNAHINRAIRLVAAGEPKRAGEELRQVERTLLADRFLRNPFYSEVRDRLQSATLASAADRVAIQRELMELNTISNVFTRTRKREVQDAAQRRATSIRVPLSPAERAFYDRVLNIARDEYHRGGRGGTPGFAMVMKERQAASCLIALRETFEAATRRRGPVPLSVERSPFDLHDPDQRAHTGSGDDLLDLSRAIGTSDSKFDAFEHVLRETLADDPSSKALVFSFFRGTLAYLYRRLREAGYQVEMIHGDVPIPERLRLIDEFRRDPDLRVLLSSEVGAEGLDFEFCDVLVNYDLPWNPMQVEQRIGRLDRFGQEHATIRIFNLFIDDSIETRIFERLYHRIGIFERSIGDLEAILGEEITDLTRAVFQAALTPEEEVLRAEEAAVRIERAVRDQEELDQRRDELLGQGRILDQQVDETVDSGRIVSRAEVEALVMTFLRESFPRACLVADDQEPCWTVDIDHELAGFLQRLIEQRFLRPRTSDLLQRTLSQRGRLPFTFDSEYARQRPNLEFITVRHPFAEAARDYWSGRILPGIPASSIEIAGPAAEEGAGSFFVYVMNVRAAVPRAMLEPVIVLDDGRLAAETAHRLLARMQAKKAPLDDELLRRDPLFAARGAADSEIAGRRLSLETEARQRNEALIAARQASIYASFQAKTRRVQELQAEAAARGQNRIATMREAQIRNLMARMVAKLDELENSRGVAVSSELVACGRVRIVNSRLRGQ